MRKNTYKVVGVVLVISGITILVFGIFIFHSHKLQMHPLINDFGILSFMIWLSLVVAGLIFLRARTKRKKLRQ